MVTPWVYTQPWLTLRKDSQNFNFSGHPDADPEMEEKSENLEVKVQPIDREENDLEIFEALKNLPPKVPTDSVFRTKRC